MTERIYLHKRCRACGADLQEFLNLGSLRLNAFPQHLREIEQIQRVPLILCVCRGCGLVQLDRTVPADWMYRTYWYRSGVNETMVAELETIVYEAGQLVTMDGTGAVLDIGANDGTLLAHYETLFTSRCPYRVAVEPAHNLRDRLATHCEALFPTYFPDALADKPDLRFQIITAIACSYDVEDPTGFFQAIHDHLAPDGVAVIQFQDVEQQFKRAAFDTVCHEHLEYYSLWSLTHLFLQTGLRVQRVVQTPINGGSLRLFLRRVEDGVIPEQSVGLQLLHEAQAGLDTTTIREGNLAAFHAFKGRVDQAKIQVASALETAQEQGCVIDVYGASTKGNILLQVLEIGPTQVRQAIDRSPEKWGFHTITGIPIVDESRAAYEPADLWLCPIWQFKEFMLRRERWYLEQGGTILFPLPRTEIVRADWKVRG